MFGSSISRWTMLHFGASVAAFVAAQIVMAAGSAYPAAPIAAPTTFVAVHLLTIGWLTLLMLGALHQFVPVITARPAKGQTTALCSLLAISVGLAAMVIGFLALAGSVPSEATAALPFGGTAVVVGVALAAIRLVPVLCTARPLTLPAGFVLAGLAFLILTVGLGLTFAVILAFPAAFPWGGFLAGSLRLHVTSGLVGWFGLTALGVSYRLLSMFMLAPEERGWLGKAAFLLASLGLLAAWIAGLVQATGIASTGAVVEAGAVAASIGIAFYLSDMIRLYRTRRRRDLELNSRMAAAALVALAVALVLVIGLEIAGRLDEFAGPVVYLLIFGWLSGLGLSQLYKIVPFLTWIERYGNALGKGPVPRVQDLVCERRARPWFILYFASVAAGTACGFVGWAGPWRLAILGHLLATIAIARELWRTRHHASISATRLDVSAPAPSGGATPRRAARQQGVLS